jgi:hypothetical protein
MPHLHWYGEDEATMESRSTRSADALSTLIDTCSTGTLDSSMVTDDEVLRVFLYTVTVTTVSGQLFDLFWLICLCLK